MPRQDGSERQLDRNGCEHDLTGRLRKLVASAADNDCTSCRDQLSLLSFVLADEDISCDPIPSPLAHASGLTRHLSQREEAILRLLGSGYDNRSIAQRLSLSEYTVKRHITNILAKLELTSRLQAGLAAQVMSCPLRNGRWHLGGMDDLKSAAYAYRTEMRTEEEVTRMTIEERTISVARNSLPG